MGLGYLTASDEFPHPTQRVNELWQTDFTQFKITGWGYYYLSTVLDDFSRYILAWKLTTRRTHSDVQDTLDLAIAAFVQHYNHHRYHEALNNITTSV